MTDIDGAIRFNEYQTAYRRGYTEGVAHAEQNALTTGAAIVLAQGGEVEVGDIHLRTRAKVKMARDEMRQVTIVTAEVVE